MQHLPIRNEVFQTPRHSTMPLRGSKTSIIKKTSNGVLDLDSTKSSIKSSRRALGDISNQQIITSSRRTLGDISNHEIQSNTSSTISQIPLKETHKKYLTKIEDNSSLSMPKNTLNVYSRILKQESSSRNLILHDDSNKTIDMEEIEFAYGGIAIDENEIYENSIREEIEFDCLLETSREDYVEPIEDILESSCNKSASETIETLNETHLYSKDPVEDKSFDFYDLVPAPEDYEFKTFIDDDDFEALISLS